MTGAVLGQAVPGFWLGLMMIYLFSVRLGWLPTGGMGGPLHFVMPCVVLASFYAARMARLTRSSVLDTLNEEFVLTARAKGLAERIVIGKHTLKNSAIPLVTLAGLDTGQLLGGAVITETIFAWPGLGRLTVQALLNRDFPVVLAAVFVFSVTYTLINFAVDLLYGWLDPRTRRAAGMRVFVARHGRGVLGLLIATLVLLAAVAAPSWWPTTRCRPTSRPASSRPARPAIRSAPTSSGGICWPACSTARGWRSSSASAACCSPRWWAGCSASSPASSRAGRARCSCGSPTCSSRSRSSCSR